jgi:CheY-like chemotaxis protein
MSQIVLVVDDDAAIRTLFTALLRGAGYDSEGVADGEEALAYLRTHPVPALILLDLAMPRVDGREFQRRQLLDPVLSAVPVLFVSEGVDVAQAAAELDVLGALSKACATAAQLGAVARHTRPGGPGRRA